MFIIIFLDTYVVPLFNDYIDFFILIYNLQVGRLKEIIIKDVKLEIEDILIFGEL